MNYAFKGTWISDTFHKKLLIFFIYKVTSQAIYYLLTL